MDEGDDLADFDVDAKMECSCNNYYAINSASLTL